MLKKPKISAEVTQEQYDALAEEAKAAKKTLSDYIRDRLFSPKPLSPPVREGAPTPKTPAMEHPCFFLSPSMPGGYTARDCQGSCRNNKQPGKACFWTSLSAAQCPMFEPKVRMNAILSRKNKP